MQPCRKIVVIGPESTGKSTLCQQLAEHYHTAWVPEFAREYLLSLHRPYSYEDLLLIARGQLEEEDRFVASSKNSLLFIDTDMYVMKVWCEFVFGKCHPFILDQIVKRRYDAYLLCKNDLPWVADELREYPDMESRERLFHIYRDLMINQNTAWTEISGDYDQRVLKAIAATNRLIEKNPEVII
jgi:NadR type nicotinamide-nucleotide adenylyltransferase